MSDLVSNSRSSDAMRPVAPTGRTLSRAATRVLQSFRLKSDAASNSPLSSDQPRLPLENLEVILILASSVHPALASKRFVPSWRKKPTTYQLEQERQQRLLTWSHSFSRTFYPLLSALLYERVCIHNGKSGPLDPGSASCRNAGLFLGFLVDNPIYASNLQHLELTLPSSASCYSIGIRPAIPLMMKQATSLRELRLCYCYLNAQQFITLYRLPQMQSLQLDRVLFDFGGPEEQAELSRVSREVRSVLLKNLYGIFMMDREYTTVTLTQSFYPSKYRDRRV